MAASYFVSVISIFQAGLNPEPGRSIAGRTLPGNGRVILNLLKEKRLQTQESEKT